MNNLSTVRVDELSDSQIRAFIKQATASGMSETQMIEMAKARGMSQEEIQKLKRRVEAVEQGQLSDENGSMGSGERKHIGSQQRGWWGQDSARLLNDSLRARSYKQLETEADKALAELRAKIFGADLFKQGNTVFEPNLRIATPKNYIIGADDDVLLDIYGDSEASYSLTVSPEGSINIPYVGVVSVGGITIEQASIRLKNKLSKIYTGLSSGGTQMTLSIGNIRSIQVIVTGEVVRPGTYTLPSVATAFNALYASGGPTEKGTMRHIRIIRGGKEVAALDVYDFLIHGSSAGNVNLQDQDVIQVSPYISRVEVQGAVKHPALFEIKEDETLSQLFKYAGGFTADAYRGRISVFRNTDIEHRVEDIPQTQFDFFQPQSGDRFVVGRVLDRFANRVKIQGAVFRPGVYELSQGLTLSMLIKKAEGLKEDAFLKRGYIIRLKDDLQREQLSFSVADILAGIGNDVLLRREDEVTIFSIFDLKDEYKVQIQGEIRKEGTYDFSEGMRVEELIMRAGGFKEGASEYRIEVSRRLRADDIDSTHTASSQVYNVHVNRDLSIDTSSFVLRPYDVVVVRSFPGYEPKRMVRIEGEVLYPGIYAISRKDERISDLIKRAGGFTAYAYLEGASLKRANPEELLFSDSLSSKFGRTDSVRLQLYKQRAADRLHMATAIQEDVAAGTALNKDVDLQRPNEYVGIDLTNIMKHVGSADDLLLENGDLVNIPKQLQTVRVSGEVLAPVTTVYNKKRRLQYYISQAGGFGVRAMKRRAYVVYANGSAKSTSSFLFFKHYPEIRPGAEIFVPKKPMRERMNAQTWIGLGSVMASLGAVIVTLLNK